MITTFLDCGAVRVALLTVFLMSTPYVASTTQAAEPEPAFAYIERVLGEIVMIRDGVAGSANAGRKVERRDRIRTGALSRAQILFVDGSRLILGADTEVAIEDFMTKQGRQRGVLLMSVPQGAFRLVLSQAVPGPQRNIVIQTANATFTVGAHDVWAGPVDGGQGVIAFDGKVHVRNSAGSLVLARKRQGTLVRGADIPPDQAAVWSRSEIEAALLTVAID